MKRRSAAPTASPRHGPGTDDPDVVRRLLGRLRMRCRAEDAAGSDAEPRMVGPDVVGATILLSRALASCPGLAEAMDEGAPVVTIEVPHSDWIDPMATAAATCFGIAPPLERRPYRPAAAPRNGPGRAIVLSGSARRRTCGEVIAGAAKAFRDHRPLIGIASIPRLDLPDEVLRACDHALAVGTLDSAATALLVEAVVGRSPTTSIAAEIAEAAQPADLRIAVHRSRGADGSSERLAAVVGRRLRSSRTAEGPRLEDLAGYGAAAEWGLAAAADLVAYGRGLLEWSGCQPGVLLAGLPGTGKTIFARALARQAGVPLHSGSLAQWQADGEAHLGTTLKSMRRFFEEARKAAPCIALVDELDSFGDRRRLAEPNRTYHVQVVNAFLECLDGDGGRAGVVLVGTTNDPGSIDPAILRSGRFDRCIEIPLPSTNDLKEILRYHLGGDLADVDLADAARRSFGGSGADCASWVRRARGRARRSGRPIRLADLTDEIGAAESDAGPEEARRIAVHESGHALLAWVLGMAVGDMTLSSAGRAGSAATCVRLPDVPTAAVVVDVLTVTLGGRAAEILEFGAPSAGAASDLAMATEICGRMHCRWGLGANLAVCDPAHAPESARTAVEETLHQAMERAIRTLSDRRCDLNRLTEALLERGSLLGAEVVTLLAECPNPSSLP